MLDGLTVKSIIDKPTSSQLIDIEVVVVGRVTKDELDSLRYCVKNDYDFALYAAQRKGR